MPRIIDAEVMVRMARMAVERETRTWSAREVHRQLCREFPQPPDREPISLRKVETEWPRLRDASQKWTLRPGDQDPAFLLNIQRVRPELTVDEVEWVSVIHAARPDLLPGDTLSIASNFRVTERLPERLRGVGLADDLTRWLGDGKSGQEIRDAFELRLHTVESESQP
jgi:hypothetical protein